MPFTYCEMKLTSKATASNMYRAAQFSNFLSTAIYLLATIWFALDKILKAYSHMTEHWCACLFLLLGRKCNEGITCAKRIFAFNYINH